MKLVEKSDAAALPEGQYVVVERGVRYTATFDDALVMEAAAVLIEHDVRGDFATKAEVVGRARELGWMSPVTHGAK